MATIILPPGSGSAALQAAINSAPPGVNTIITISSDMVFTGIVTIPAGWIITLVANGNWSLIGGNFIGNAFNVNGTLNLGEANPSPGTNLTITGFNGSAIRPSGGVLTMYSGTISGNQSAEGGGLNIQNSTFIMYGGEISNNEAGTGGGITLAGLTSNFNMYGGSINGNEAGNGAGIIVIAGATFTMYGGIISGNTANHGGGVEVRSAGSSFTMHGGEISGNFAAALWGGGGGVAVTHNAANIFTMNGGTISGNRANNNGGGVLIYSNNGNFTMTGGVIRSNEARYGGGIYNSALSEVNISGTAEITNNTATYNEEGRGGGIYTADFYRLTVIGPGVRFSNNRADFATHREPENDTVYATHILNMAGRWTRPFRQGYNNYDINQNGEIFEEEDCKLIIIILALFMFLCFPANKPCGKDCCKR